MLIAVADTCSGEDVNVSQNYTNALLRAGLTPVVLPRTGSTLPIREMIERVDGLLLPGGGSDVNPALYGEEAMDAMGPIDDYRDQFEYALLREAVVQRKPVMGICRGLQVINIYFGGTLYQDLPAQKTGSLLNHQRPDKKWEGVHPLEILPGTRLAALIGSDRCEVNSTHHQAVKTVAPGFRISAQSPDGVVEAIESETLPIMAVQFHPERLAWGDDTRFTGLFEQVFK